MPFTPSHIAAVLPFVRTPLAPAALVIGSMVPDLPFFIPLGLHRELTHSLAGAFSVDLPIAVIALLAWSFIFRAPLIDFGPSWLRRRIRAPAQSEIGWRARSSPTVIALASILVGIATHLAWDSFTHQDGWFVLRVALLRETLGPLAVYRWAQYLSSVIGLVFVAVWIVGWVRRTPAREGASHPGRVSGR